MYIFSSLDSRLPTKLQTIIHAKFNNFIECRNRAVTNLNVTTRDSVTLDLY